MPELLAVGPYCLGWCTTTPSTGRHTLESGGITSPLLVPCGAPREAPLPRALAALVARALYSDDEADDDDGAAAAYMEAYAGWVLQAQNFEDPNGIDVRIAGGRLGTSTNCAPPNASRFRRFTMAWRMAQAVIAAATSATSRRLSSRIAARSAAVVSRRRGAPTPPSCRGSPRRRARGAPHGRGPVSYTHLTLPTKRIV